MIEEMLARKAGDRGNADRRRDRSRPELAGAQDGIVKRGVFSTREGSKCTREPAASYLLCRSACALGAAERAGNALYDARVYVELGRRLAHAHAARQGRPDTLSQLVLHAWPAVGPRGRGLAPFRR